MDRFRSCVTPEGRFIYGIHKPAYTVANMRPYARQETLGHLNTTAPIENSRNFPNGDIEVAEGGWVYEIPNPLPFKGVTYIGKNWADNSAENPERIRIAPPQQVSFTELLTANNIDKELLEKLPEPMLLSLATCSTDPEDLVVLAELSCEIEKNDQGIPTGITYALNERKEPKPLIHKHMLFEAVANNPYLPDPYKVAMVILPGAQGGSEIVGDFSTDSGESHVYEYLRRNSYISGGHYAANMAEDAIRYAIQNLSRSDMTGLRHLYYQRTYIRLAEQLSLPIPAQKRLLSPDELESLRHDITKQISSQDLNHNGTLWGWNFGFDYAPSKYRLHASHQQIHQQYAMIPDTVDGYYEGDQNTSFTLPSFGCGDMIADVMQRYRKLYDRDFFVDYLSAITSNARMDDRTDLESSLVIWRDEQVMLFVPKAQTSQWELQLITFEDDSGYPPGNIVEANRITRESLDTGIFMAQKALAGLGAQMVTSIEYPKRIGKKGELGQPLLYAFHPRLPESPGAFSEAQLRFINGHYPEDFAAVCRKHITQFLR